MFVKCVCEIFFNSIFRGACVRFNIVIREIERVCVCVFDITLQFDDFFHIFYVKTFFGRIRVS